MAILRMPTDALRAQRGPADVPRLSEEPLRGRKSPLDGELLDLYAAILIAVPLALFLKSLFN